MPGKSRLPALGHFLLEFSLRFDSMKEVLERFLSWFGSFAVSSGAMSFDCEKLQRRQARLDHYGRFTTATV